MSKPLSIPEARALVLSSFEQLSKSRDPASRLVGTVAITLMGSMEGERLQMHQRVSELQVRVIELEMAAKVD